MIISLGIDKNCSYIYALPKREKDKESTNHTARTSTNMSLLLSTSAKVLTSSPPQRFHYEITRQALNKPSAFVRNTYNKKLYIPPYNDASWKAIQYFSWSSSPNYSAICTNVLQRITKNNTFYIISGSINGGLGHKYLSVFYSITYAILLGRRFLRMNDV